jgi:hypothetical protein
MAAVLGEQLHRRSAAGLFLEKANLCPALSFTTKQASLSSSTGPRWREATRGQHVIEWYPIYCDALRINSGNFVTLTAIRRASSQAAARNRSCLVGRRCAILLLSDPVRPLRDARVNNSLHHHPPVRQALMPCVSRTAPATHRPGATRQSRRLQDATGGFAV